MTLGTTLRTQTNCRRKIASSVGPTTSIIWAGWGRWTPAKQLKRAGIGGVSPGLASFGFGPGGSPTPVKLEGSAGIDLKIEVSADSDSVVRKVAQFIRTSGNMRDDTGTTMAPTP